jgi:dipeptidase E
MYILCLSRGLGAIAPWIAEQPSSELTVGFLPNAGDTYTNSYFVDESRRRLEILGLSTKPLDLRDVDSSAQFESLIAGCDAVFAAGGNSFNLVHELHRSGAMPVLRQAIVDGLPYFGESAGAAILYREITPFAMIDDPQDVPQLISPDALNLVDFMTLPHINREKYRDLFDRFYDEMSRSHRIIKIRDDQAILTRDGTSTEIVSSPIAELPET